MILVVDLNGKKDSLGYYEFVAPIVSMASELDTCIVKHYSEITREEDTHDFSKVILSGTALKDNVTLGQPEKFIWLKSIEKPVLGICAGMQTIGVVFGLQLTKCLEIGMTRVTTLKDNSLFSDEFRVYSLHNYSVQSSAEFDALAESAQCLQAVKHRQKPLYGVLFHPEVRNAEVIKRFIQLKT
jgi:GMP synthase-like glutamine amidotransferase